VGAKKTDSGMKSVKSRWRRKITKKIKTRALHSNKEDNLVGEEINRNQTESGDSKWFLH